MRYQDIAHASPDEMLRDILDTVNNLRAGHFTAHATQGFPGLYGEIARALNEHLDLLYRFRHEHHRLMEQVGVTGRLGGQMEVPGASGAWKEMVDDVNRTGANITGQFRDGANVVTDLLAGQTTARMTAKCIQGEFGGFRNRMNELADRLERQTEAVAP